MKIENTSIYGIDRALFGMRAPMASWEKSDSYWLCSEGNIKEKYIIGPNDMNLCKRLIKAGPEHRKFLRQIFISVDITAPLYWWKEFDTYKIGITANSTSTMHKLASTPITLDCFETDDYTMDVAGLIQNLGFVQFIDGIEGYDLPAMIINFCEDLRQKYNETKDKRYWKELVRWLPEGWLQTRTVTMNYENARSMYEQRRNHKLTEWSESFCSWCESLPYFKEFFLLDN